MSVAIISDAHNNEVNLKKVLQYCAEKKIEKIICCGDLASNETLDLICNNFSGEIFYTFGNMEDGHFDLSLIAPKNNVAGDPIRYKNSHIYKKFGETEIDRKKIAFVHYPNQAKALAETGKYDFVFYGHTHKPWTEVIGNCTMLNPGNVTGDLYPPTFAVWNAENNKFELIRIHNLK
jgi:uncharacterized protein